MREFSLVGFIEHVAKLPAAVLLEQHEALKKAAEIVEAEAKREIGHYQGDAGPFMGWMALAESTVADKEKGGYAPPDNPLLRTGDMRDSIGHRAGDTEAVIGSDSEVAAAQELGYLPHKLPPRSFLGGAAFRKGPEVAELCGAFVVRALTGEGVVRKSLPIP